MSQPKLTLRPPPHREFIQGFPGIVGSSTRPPAHVAGTVEVRLGTKGLKAAWLRIELRKLETLPGGESWGELIGRGPIDVWSARKDEAYKSEAEKGWELLQTADFPFQVTIPEGLPPSAKLEKNAGIAYELVTSLCVRIKKGLLKKEVTSSIIQNTHPLWLDKHELHSTWPVYATPEDHEAIQDDIRVKVLRNRTCFGPGDSIDVRVIISSERVTPIKIKNVSFSVRETITFKNSTKKTFGSNKAASQKTETLSSKSKSFGKKVYKGDMHTFDLACQIPRTHTLMTIQTAKHIEVSYTLRVQVETAKKPIIIDHLPITVSNFTRTASDALVARIGWVPGLSVPSDSTEVDGYPRNGAIMPSSGSIGSQPTITRSMSFNGSTYSGSRGSYPGYPGGDLRRRDTVMTQGTAVSGPGMAGRGVPGQVFSWGQYGSAQPFGAGEPPRPAFAGPPSIYEGRELAPEENRALFHSTNRPQSAMVLGTAIDPVLVSASSYHGHSGGVTPIQEGSEDGHLHSNLAQRSPWQSQAQLPSIQQDFRRHSQYSGTASPRSFTPAQGMRYSGSGVIASDHRNTPADGSNSYTDVPYRGPGTSEVGGTTRYVRPEPVHQAIPSQLQAASPLRGPGVDSNSPITSAETEKQQLYERARQQAERNQRRADERRAFHQGTATSPSTPSSAMGNGGRTYNMLDLASSSGFSSSAQVPAAAVGLSAEAEKTRLFERARAEAERYQSSYQQGAAFPAMGTAAGSSSQSNLPAGQGAANGTGFAGSSSVPGASGSQALVSGPISPMVSGQVAPYPSYMSAEEEKRQLYERAKAEADAYQRGEASTTTVTGPNAAAEPSSGHQQAASLSQGAAADIPGAWPEAAPALALANNPTPAAVQDNGASTSSVNGAAGSSTTPAPGGAISEKEQLRRYYEARDAVSQHLQQTAAAPAPSSSGAPAGVQSHGMYAPEVASAVHHATPHQPADTVATPTRGTTKPAAIRPTITTTGVQSYLTESEQQSAVEKERLASHYARKAAKAEAKTAAQPSPGTPNGHASAWQGASSGGANEKAQLAAYYAARDAMEETLRAQSQAPAHLAGAASGSTAPVATAAFDAHHRNKGTSTSTNVDPVPAPDQWRPKYNSLYDESDIDLLDHFNAGPGNGVNGSVPPAAAAPPPLPPKIPIGTGNTPLHTSHRPTSTHPWS